VRWLAYRERKWDSKDSEMNWSFWMNSDGLGRAGGSFRMLEIPRIGRKVDTRE
jgi:hypothetical protein